MRDVRVLSFGARHAPPQGTQVSEEVPRRAEECLLAFLPREAPDCQHEPVHAKSIVDLFEECLEELRASVTEPVPYRPSRIWGPDTPRAAVVLDELLIALVSDAAAAEWWLVHPTSITRLSVAGPGTASDSGHVSRPASGSEVLNRLRDLCTFPWDDDAGPARLAIKWGGSVHHFGVSGLVGAPIQPRAVLRLQIHRL